VRGGREPLRGLRVGVVQQELGFPVDPSITIFFDGAVQALAELGATLASVQMPPLPYRDMVEVIAESEGFDAFADLIESGKVEELDDPCHDGHARPASPLAVDYVRAMRLRTKLSRELEATFDSHDVLVALNSPILAPRLDQPLPRYGGDVMRLVGNLAGLPAVGVPMGHAPPGRLPVSFQIVGRPHSDALVLSVAAAYQAVSAWHLERPTEG
jgi:aspartyl-tRNA(Asn)/glutamyl-tRNA(Gln) amidotransferase subunit A